MSAMEAEEIADYIAAMVAKKIADYIAAVSAYKMRYIAAMVRAHSTYINMSAHNTRYVHAI